MKFTNYIALGFLALACVGCSTKKSTTPTQNTRSETPVLDNNPSAHNATVVTPEPINQPDMGTAINATTSALTTAFTVDDTWNTYSNAALKFEFKWPTKGTYAPAWSVAFGKEGDGLIQDGCAMDQNNTIKSVTGQFCHSISIVDSGDRSRTDYFATKKGNQYIIIKLQKNFVTMSDKCRQSGITTSANSCKEFKADEYASLLDTIISTFKYTE